MNDQIPILMAQANNTLGILEENRKFYFGFLQGDYKKLGRNTASAIVFSQIFINFLNQLD